MKRAIIPILIIAVALMLSACTAPVSDGDTDQSADTSAPTTPSEPVKPAAPDTDAAVDDEAEMTGESPGQIPSMSETAYFAGGCFWCTEADFEKVPGVESVVSGYTGGDVANPEYKQVSSGTTGHRETVKVVYNPAVVPFEHLLEVFFRIHDPTDAGGSFVDRGFQYSSAIYYVDEAQREAAETVIAALEDEHFDKDIVTALEPFTVFYVAEEYHQDYHSKNPIRYSYYRSRSGRDDYIESMWGDYDTKSFAQSLQATLDADTAKPWESYVKPPQERLQEVLTPLEYEVTQEEGTERPFQNEYDTNKEPGIYVDILSGEPLYSSTHKYDSGTGWPSFWQPLVPENIVMEKDYKLIIPRTEIRSKYGDNHIGHVFNDGPAPTGLRYCMNSAALRFVHADELEEQGYGEFSYLFE